MKDSLNSKEKVKHTFTKDMLIRNIAEMCDENMFFALERFVM